MKRTDMGRSILVAWFAAAPFSFTGCDDNSDAATPTTKADGDTPGQSPGCQGPGAECQYDAWCCGAGLCQDRGDGVSVCNGASYLENGQACTPSAPNAMCMPGSFCNNGVCGL